MSKILVLLITTLFLSGCDLYNFDKSPKDNPTTTQGTVGDAKDLVLVSGANQVGLVNTALGTAYEVKMFDSKSRPIVGDTINFTILDANAQIVHTQTVTTDSSGVASLNIIPTVFGQLSIKIEAANTSNTVAPLVVPVKVIGPPDSISIVSGNNQTISAGSALGVVKFLMKDANGEFVPNGSATINASAVTSNSSGEISYTLSTPNTLTGTYTFNASLANSASVVVTYSVIPSAPATLTIVSGNTQALTAGDNIADMVTELKDSSGNLVPNTSVDFCGNTTTSNASGLATYNGGLKTVAGSYTCTVTVGSLTQNFSYTVSAGAVASLDIISGNNQTITAGGTLASMVLDLKDAFGNLRAGVSVDFCGTNITSNASGRATYSPGTKTVSGSFSCVATVGALTQTFSYTVNPASPATLTIISGNSQTLTAGDTSADMVVELKDSYSNLTPNISVDFCGTSATSNSSGRATYSPGVKTVAGSFTCSATAGSLSQSFGYTVSAGALASLAIDSGDNQVLPRSVNSSSMKLKGYDLYSNLKSGPTITWTDGTWSSTSTLTSGIASMVYPTPLLTGTKTITASNGSVSISFTLTVNNYAPLTATISTGDDLTYSTITTRNIVSGDRIYLGPVSVTPGSAPSTNRGWVKSGSGTSTPTDLTPGSETNLNTSLSNVSSPSDVLSVVSTATFPSGVTANSCSLVNPAVDGLTCSVNNTMTFTRDKILGGAFQIKVQSSNAGGPEDYKLSNTLATAKKVIVEQYVFGAHIGVAGGTGKHLYVLDDSFYPAVWDIENKTITRLSNNTPSGINYASGFSLFFYSGRFVFLATDPADSNIRVMSYDPQTDSFAIVATLGGSIDSSAIGTGYIDTNGVLNLCGTNKRNILVASDFSITYGTSSGTTGCWITLFSASGTDYGLFTITGAGYYKRTNTAMTKVGNTFYSGSPLIFSPITTSANGYVVDATNGLFSVNATQIKKLSSTGATQGKAFGNRVIVATKDSNNRNKLFVYNEGDSTYKKVRDFNTSANDFNTGDYPILGVYNGNAYVCVTVGSQPTIFQYDGTNLKQLAQVGSCTRIRETSAVVDNALWFNLNNTLTRICDTSAGCQ